MSVFKFGVARSPPRRPTFRGSDQSPFCTSPSQLQDVTFDASMSGTIPFSLASPGKTSPIPGHFMKEQEEMLAHLKKENFNLKLRIYFLEERMEQRSGAEDKEGGFKKYIELKVETESLRKSLNEKTALLVQASEAIDILERDYRAKVGKLESQNVLMEDHIQKLKQALKVHDDGIEVGNLKQNELVDGINYKAELESLHQHIHDLESRIQCSEANCKKLHRPKEEVEGLVQKVQSLEAKCLDIQPKEKVEELEQLVQNLQAKCLAYPSSEEVYGLEKQIEDLKFQNENMRARLLQEENRGNEQEAEVLDLQQLSEQLETRGKGLEEEIWERDCKLQALVEELEEKTKNIATLKHKICALDEIVVAKTMETDIKIQEMNDKDNQIKTLQERQRQMEAMKVSLAARDATIAEAESDLAKATATIRNWEAKLDATRHETVRLAAELETVKSQHKKNLNRSREFNTDLDSLSIHKSSSNLLTSEVTSPTGKTPLSNEEGKRISAVKNGRYADTGELSVKQCAELKQKNSELKLLQKKLRETKSECKQEVQQMQEQMQEIENKLSNKVAVLHHQLVAKAEKLREVDGESKHKDDMLQILKDQVGMLQHEVEKLACSPSEEKYKCLKDEYVKSCQAIQGFLKSIKNLEQENKQLKSHLDRKNGTVQDASMELYKTRIQTKQVSELHNGPTEVDFIRHKSKSEPRNMAVRAESHKGLRENESQMECTKEKEDQFDVLKRMSEAAAEGHLNMELELLENLGATWSRESYGELLVQLEDKKGEVRILNAELQKRTSNLQELVNKELWDKNREIEKLQDRLNSLCERKELEIMSLEHEMESKDMKIKVLEDRMLEIGVHPTLTTSIMMRELNPATFPQHIHLQQQSQRVGEDACMETLDTSITKEDAVRLHQHLESSLEERMYLCRTVDELKERLRNTPERDSDNRVVATLRAEVTQAREEVEQAEKCRQETVQACMMLTRRLEELAGFLTSLLRHGQVLGKLGVEQRDLLQQAVDSSMELSRRLSMSFTVGPGDITRYLNSLPDFSVPINCSNIVISELLEDKGEINASSLSFGECVSKQAGMLDNSHARNKVVEDQAQVISHLESQVEMLQQQVKQRESELALMHDDDILDKFKQFLACSMQSTNICREDSTVAITLSMNNCKNDVGDEDCPSLSSMTFYNRQLLESNTSSMVLMSSLLESVPQGDKMKEVGTPTKNLMDKSLARTPTRKPAVALSDSEAWSEPDRNVSMARIGLWDDAVKGVGKQRHTRTAQDEDESSESSVDDNENNRTTGKRSKSESGEGRRLHTKVRSLERVNAVLRSELNILHQLASTTQEGQSLMKEDAKRGNSTLTESDRVLPSLLKQIRHGREKLEYSLLHNDFIRHKLEAILGSIEPGHKLSGANLQCQLRDTIERLEEVMHQSEQLEAELERSRMQAAASGVMEQLRDTTERLQKVKCRADQLEVELEHNRGKAAAATILGEQLEAGVHTVATLKKEIESLEVKLKERDDEIVEKQQLLSDLKSRTKRHSVEIEKAINEANELKLDCVKRVTESESLRSEAQAKVLILEKELQEAEKKIVSMKERKGNVEHQLITAQDKAQMMENRASEADEKMRVIASELQRCTQETVEYKAELDEAKRVNTEQQAECRRQIEELQDHERQVQDDIEKRIHDLQEEAKVREADLKQKLRDNEHLFRNIESDLHCQLDAFAISTSRASLEQVRTCNEKQRLEQEIRRQENLVTELTFDKRELEGRLAEHSHQLENKVASLEEQKGNLEKRVHDLENANSALDSSLARLQIKMQHLSYINQSEQFHGVISGSVSPLTLPKSESEASSLGLPGDGGSVWGNVMMGPRFEYEGSRNRRGVWGITSTGPTSLEDQSDMPKVGDGRPALSRQLSEMSGYISEDQPYDDYEGVVTQRGNRYWMTVSEHHSVPNLATEHGMLRNINSSPDLGIESDQGRLSSLEAVTNHHPPRVGHLASGSGDEAVSALVINSRNGVDETESSKLQQENATLKRHLRNTRYAFKEALVRLKTANNKKKMVEKAICKEINKTHNILKQTRTNMECQTNLAFTKE